MRKLLLAAVAALALSGPALAHNHAGDLVCEITDQSGNALSYSFANNTVDDPNVESNAITGTYVETAFSRNGQLTASPEGSRPVWRHTSMTDREIQIIESQNEPGWSLVLENISRNAREMLFRSSVRLVHNGSTVGSGVCTRDLKNNQPAASSPRVPDESAN
jgi:hypothetical protein